MAWIDVPQVPGAQRAATARARAADGDRGWYRITNAAAPDEATLYLYDEIGGYFGVTAEQFVTDLSTVTSPNLRVHVNSPGGSVFEGLAVANALRAHPANVTVQVDGLAASIASVIAMAADRVELAPQAMIMVHEASGACFGPASEMEKMAEVLDLISENIAGAYAAKAGGTVDDWRATMKAETWYLADDAVAAGLADEALPTGAAPAPDEDDDPEMHARFDLAAYGYNGPAKPEKPKPGPPPAKPASAAPVPTLVISIADALDEEAMAAIRAAVRATDVPAEPEGTGPQAGTEAAPELPPVAPEPPTNLVPDTTDTGDGWEAAVAHLTAPDDWTALTSHLTESSATGA